MRERRLRLGGRGQGDTDLLLYKFFNKLSAPLPASTPDCLEVSGINGSDLRLIESSNSRRKEEAGRQEAGAVQWTGGKGG